mgnify:CR=1 FL=1
MSDHPSRYTGPDFLGHVQTLIQSSLPGAKAEVHGGGGHYTVSVTAQAFAGKSLLEQQRMVLSILKDLLSGTDAPIHAIDKLTTRVG